MNYKVGTRDAVYLHSRPSSRQTPSMQPPFCLASRVRVVGPSVFSEKYPSFAIRIGEIECLKRNNSKFGTILRLYIQIGDMDVASYLSRTDCSLLLCFLALLQEGRNNCNLFAIIVVVVFICYQKIVTLQTSKVYFSFRSCLFP